MGEGKVTHNELCNIYRYSHTIKYMHKPLFEVESHDSFWDFELQKNHLILVESQYLFIIKKRFYGWKISGRIKNIQTTALL